MKKIKVYLQYPWKFPDSPYYKYLIDNPPKNVEYLNTKKQKGVIINKKFFWFSNFLKRNIRRWIKIFNLSIPNAHLSQKGDYDLIHCAHCLSKNKDKPWVMDIESEWQLYIGNKTKMAKEKVRKLLLNKNCKRILPWTKSTADEIIKDFPEIKNKVEVVYPAVPLHKKTNKKNKKITILYATRYFWLKGGLIALEVYKRLKEQYKDKLELIFISDVPKNIKKRYLGLEIKNLVSQKELFKLYSKSDIFFYPSFVDTFGFGLLEAMSFGLPIVTLNTKKTRTRKEIIENNKNGMIFDINEEITKRILREKDKLIINREIEEIISKLFYNVYELIENKNLREKMSKNCLEEIENGKFSIENRNKKLKRIYQEVLK
jgi:glycosyltransferase involved in cell wall biosynthesis